MSLILTRRPGETLMIGDAIRITVVAISCEPAGGDMRVFASRLAILRATLLYPAFPRLLGPVLTREMFMATSGLGKRFPEPFDTAKALL